MAARDSDTVDQVRSPGVTSPAASAEVQFQPAGFLIEMSLDWIVLRASENVDDCLGESHVTLIEEPLGRFVQAQALHDLRNHFSRLSGSTGIGRAYRVRLTDERPRFDIAFHMHGGRVLLEATPSTEEGFGEAIGSVGGLIESLSQYRGDVLLKEAARRMRALTGYDRCLVEYGEHSAQSNRSKTAPASHAMTDIPAIVTDLSAAPVPIFPRKSSDGSVIGALLKSASAEALQGLRDLNIRSALTVPLRIEGQPPGVIQCTSLSAVKPSFELHAAAELFAQMLALRIEVDRLRS